MRSHRRQWQDTRRSFDKASSKAAIHMVSAWASKAGVVLGQVKTDEHGHG